MNEEIPYLMKYYWIKLFQTVVCDLFLSVSSLWHAKMPSYLWIIDPCQAQDYNQGLLIIGYKTNVWTF